MSTESHPQDVELHPEDGFGCGLPFDLGQSRYSAETEAAMDEAREILSDLRSARRFASVEEMREAFDIRAG